jgi:(E)-4-hydroxy-3-methyl-but-2-enyl pyrophosphate reductase
MSIRLAKRIGFCFGVRRAVQMAEEALKNKGPIYSLGSIIHNEQVVDALSKKGLKVIRDIDDITSGTVIVSSHGLSPKTASRMVAKGLKIIDTTCPFVMKAQNIARRLGSKAMRIVIIGDSRHPEIKALVDFVPKKISVVSGKAGADRLRISGYEKVGVISQTTQSTENFMAVVESIRKKKPRELEVYNTICRDADQRQRSAKLIARSVDVMLIIGGKDSANTKRLFEVCSKISKKSHRVQTESDVKKRWFAPESVVGIASGASTPDWVIKKVVNKVKQIQKSKETSHKPNSKLREVPYAGECR